MGIPSGASGAAAGHAAANHNLLLTNRSKLDITGVSDVQSFDDTNITISTALGSMMIEGRQLHIVNLSIDRGELTVEGTISGIIYFESAGKEKGGFWSRVFK